MCVGRRRFARTSGLDETICKTDTLMRARCFQDQCKRPDYCCSFTESYSKLLLPPPTPPPPFGGFHSSPITSSNDSNLSPRACGLSKNGRHMWGKWEAVAEIRRRGTWAPRAIRKDMQMQPSSGWWVGGGLQLGTAL